MILKPEQKSEESVMDFIPSFLQGKRACAEHLQLNSIDCKDMGPATKATPACCM